MISLGTAPTVFNFVELQPNYVVAARKGLTVPENVKPRTGPAKVTDSVTSTGADVTSVVKRTSTGR